MMEVIMILTVIAVFFINFIFIDNIYRIVDPKPIQVSKKSINSSLEALILGDETIGIKISDLLIKQNISADILPNINDIDKSYPYKYVLALFNDDLENLTACTIAINIMGINNVIAICNKQYNQKIYDDNHIVTINSYASAFDIVSILLNNQKKREA
ncbi:MAG: hypothetical protein K0Q97_2752 [Bacillota bacterium]|jgi:hypothetical protein|nr:hypothetical protein [Bacillota bacterium]MDF2949323.1 hypothetical protein [Sedimentibacter sp.]